MATAKDILNAAYTDLAVKASGQTLPTSLLKDGLGIINRWIDSISNFDMFIYEQTEENFPLVSGQSEYSIGEYGAPDFDTVRPQRLLDGAFIRNAGSTFDYPVKIVSLKAYRRFRDKSVESRPIYMAYNPTYPNGTIYLFRTPDDGRTLHLISNKQVPRFSSLNATVSFPPGYERFIVTNGAIALASSRGRSVSPELANEAKESKDGIRNRNKQNIEPVRLGELSRLTNGGSYRNITEGPYR